MVNVFLCLFILFVVVVLLYLVTVLDRMKIKLLNIKKRTVELAESLQANSKNIMVVSDKLSDVATREVWLIDRIKALEKKEVDDCLYLSAEISSCRDSIRIIEGE